eukprot:1179730-Prorocentrum_minimum.AAC.6
MGWWMEGGCGVGGKVDVPREVCKGFIPESSQAERGLRLVDRRQVSVPDLDQIASPWIGGRLGSLLKGSSQSELPIEMVSRCFSKQFIFEWQARNVHTTLDKNADKLLIKCKKKP